MFAKTRPFAYFIIFLTIALFCLYLFDYSLDLNHLTFNHERLFFMNEDQAAQISHQNYDIVFRSLFQDYVVDLLDYFRIPHSGKTFQWLDITNPIIQVKKEYFDLLLEITSLSKDKEIIHIEFQSDFERNDLYRFCHYDTEINRLYKNHKITTYIILFGDRITSKQRKIETTNLNYSPHFIDLNSMNGEQKLKEIKEKLSIGTVNPKDLLDLIFIPLMGQIDRNSAAIEVIEMEKKLPFDEHKKKELIGVS